MLASSSRTVFRTAQGKLSHVVADSCGGHTGPSTLSKCIAEQQRCASTAQAVIKQHVFPKLPRSDDRQGALRSGSQPDSRFRGNSPRTPLAQYNLRIGDFVERGMTAVAMQLCKRMKDEGVRPDLTTYGYILEACARDAHHAEAEAAFEDMLVMGLRPTRQLFHSLLHALRELPASRMWEVLDSMKHFHIAFDEKTYEIIILRYAKADNIELALQYLSEMGLRGLSPTLPTARGIITTASKMGYPRLALELAEAFEDSSYRRLDGDVWVECLISSSEALWEEGVTRTWQKVVHELNLTPDEGCCLQVLHTAGRHGLSELALDVLQVLVRTGTRWEEHHFAPIIEALCRGDQIKDALYMLSFMRDEKIIPVPETAYPIFQAISKDTDSVDNAWDHIESLREEGKAVDVSAVNVVIQASIALGDLQRAVGTYKALGDMDVAANVDTYNLMLSGCIKARHRQLGDRMLTEMKEANVKPNMWTYERLISLCLTQAIYEDAFFYLEEMKVEGHKPSLAIYEAIIRKCVQLGDTRYKIAVEEMTELGYTMPRNLQSFIESGGQRDVEEDGKANRRPSQRRHQAYLKDAEETVEGMQEILTDAEKTVTRW